MCLNSTLMEDSVLHQSYAIDVLAVLEQLRERHGDHPILWETEADFLDDAAEKVAKYRLAIRLAESNSLLTYTIRISLAHVLLDDFADPDQAIRELRACQNEVAEQGDDSEKKQWRDLVDKCTKQQGRAS